MYRTGSNRNHYEKFKYFQLLHSILLMLKHFDFLQHLILNIQNIQKFHQPLH